MESKYKKGKYINQVRVRRINIRPSHPSLRVSFHLTRWLLGCYDRHSEGGVGGRGGGGDTLVGPFIHLHRLPHTNHSRTRC